MFVVQATGVAAGRPAKVPKVSSCDADVPTLAKDGKVSNGCITQWTLEAGIL